MNEPTKCYDKKIAKVGSNYVFVMIIVFDLFKKI